MCTKKLHERLSRKPRHAHEHLTSAWFEEDVAEHIFRRRILECRALSGDSSHRSRVFHEAAACACQEARELLLGVARETMLLSDIVKVRWWSTALAESVDCRSDLCDRSMRLRDEAAASEAAARRALLGLEMRAAAGDEAQLPPGALALCAHSGLQLVLAPVDWGAVVPVYPCLATCLLASDAIRPDLIESLPAMCTCCGRISVAVGMCRCARTLYCEQCRDQRAAALALGGAWGAAERAGCVCTALRSVVRLMVDGPEFPFVTVLCDGDGGEVVRATTPADYAVLHGDVFAIPSFCQALGTADITPDQRRTLSSTSRKALAYDLAYEIDITVRRHKACPRCSTRQV